VVDLTKGTGLERQGCIAFLVPDYAGGCLLVVSLAQYGGHATVGRPAGVAITVVVFMAPPNLILSCM
jgi:hypothetical protein